MRRRHHELQKMRFQDPQKAENGFREKQYGMGRILINTK